MLRRKIEKQLVEWKNSSDKNPLIIKGCRQCGKTSSVLKFANENYKNVIYINFIEHPEYKLIFADSLNVNEIIKKISSLYNFTIDNDHKNNIIVLGEIQSCGNARASLKFFKLDNRYDVIATGSLLGVRGIGEEIISIPVGYESTIYMYPMDFEEFLWANNIKDETINNLNDKLLNEEVIDSATHEVMKKMILNYIVVGGMPKVVNEFINTNRIDKVVRIQKDIINDYKDDVVKYAKGNYKLKILECFNSIPSQLSKENKKFQYSMIKKGAKSRDYESCIEWLIEAGIIVKCNNLHALELPFDGNTIDDCFKLYMQDIGLLIASFEEGTQFDILNNNLYTYKGAIIENLSADILSKMGRKLYYFKKDSGLEIDFAIRYNNKCVPIEVKAKTGNAKSLNTVIKNIDVYHIDLGMKFGNYNIGRSNNILTLPLYMLFLLKNSF